MTRIKVSPGMCFRTISHNASGSADLIVTQDQVHCASKQQPVKDTLYLETKMKRIKCSTDEQELPTRKGLSILLQFYLLFSGSGPLSLFSFLLHSSEPLSLNSSHLRASELFSSYYLLYYCYLLYATPAFHDN